MANETNIKAEDAELESCICIISRYESEKLLKRREHVNHNVIDMCFFGS